MDRKSVSTIMSSMLVAMIIVSSLPPGISAYPDSDLYSFNDHPFEPCPRNSNLEYWSDGTPDEWEYSENGLFIDECGSPNNWYKILPDDSKQLDEAWTPWPLHTGGMLTDGQCIWLEEWYHGDQGTLWYQHLENPIDFIDFKRFEINIEVFDDLAVSTGALAVILYDSILDPIMWFLIEDQDTEDILLNMYAYWVEEDGTSQSWSTAESGMSIQTYRDTLTLFYEKDVGLNPDLAGSIGSCLSESMLADDHGRTIDSIGVQWYHGTKTIKLDCITLEGTPSKNVIRNPCSSAGEWVDGLGWSGYVPWMLTDEARVEDGEDRFESDNGMISAYPDQWTGGVIHSVMVYQELSPFKVNSLRDFTIDVNADNSDSSHKGKFMAILYDQNKEWVAQIYIYDWADASFAPNCIVRYKDHTGYVHSFHTTTYWIIQGTFGFTFEQDDTFTARGLYDQTATLMSLEDLWSDSDDRLISYLALSWRRGTGTYLETCVDEINISYKKTVSGRLHEDGLHDSEWQFEADWPDSFLGAIQQVPLNGGKEMYTDTIDPLSTATHGPVYVRTLDDPFRVCDGLDLTVDLRFDYVYKKMGSVYIALYDTSKKRMGGVRLVDVWYYTDRKDSAVFWYEYDGVGYNGAWSPVDSHLGDWSGYLRIWYDESTGAIKGTSIDETHTLLTAGQFDETREVGYVTIQFYSKSNYNYKSVYIDTISLTTSDEMCQDHEVYEVGVADDRPTYMSESSLMVPATTSIITLQQTQTQEATRRLLGHDIQFGFQLSSGAATYAKAIIEYQLTSGERVVEEGHEVYMQSDTYSEWRSVVVSCYIPDSGVESLCLSMVVEPTTGGLCYVDQPKVAITGTQSAICTYYNDIFMTQWDGWDIGEVGLTTMLWSSEDISSETESLTRIGVGVSSKVIMRDGYPILDQWMITAIEIVAELLPNDGSSTEQYSDLDITSYSCYSKNTVEVYNPQEIDEIAERDSILVGASMGVLTDVVVTGICIAGGITGGTAIAVGIIGGFVGDLVVGYIQNMCSTDYYDNNARGPGTNYRSRVLWDWPHKFMLEDYRVHEAGAGLLMDWKSHKDPLGETDFPNLQLKISATVTFGYHAEIDNILGSITLERIIDLNDRGI